MQPPEHPAHDAPPEWFTSPAVAEEVDTLRHWVAGLSTELARARDERDAARRALEETQAELAAARVALATARSAATDPSPAPEPGQPAADQPAASPAPAGGPSTDSSAADTTPPAASNEPVPRPEGGEAHAPAAPSFSTPPAAPQRGPLAVAAGVLRKLGLSIVVLLLLAAALLRLGPRVLPYQVYVMGSDSMGAAIPRGSLVVAWPTDIAALWPGDVVVFRTPTDGARTTTHRVVGITLRPEGAALQTRGDANPAPDPWLVRAAELQGRVVARVPLLGTPWLSLQGPLGGVLLGLPLLGLASASLWGWTAGRRPNRRGGA